MGSSLLAILLLTIWHTILIYGKSLGLNVVLFIVPVLIFFILTLKKNDLVKNKKGLLFALPITALSISYLIYDNTLFKTLNAFVIPLLFILMYVYTVRPTNRFGRLLSDLINLIFEPLGCIGKVFNLVGLRLGKVFKLSKETKKKVGSVLIVLPITIIVLYILSKADMMFANLMNSILKIFENISLSEIIGRLIIMAILFIYMAAVTNYLLFNYNNKDASVSNKRKFEPFTIELLLTVLNVIYLVFAIIQVRSLIFHKVSASIEYAKYARSGFFWLMAISIINLAILLYTKRVKNEESNTYNKVMSVIMTILTLVVLASAFARMYMYCDYYGFTTLRILVYGVLITEVILLVPTIIYIFNSKSNVLKNYLAIIVVSYVIMSLIPMNNIIAKRNIQRYDEVGKIDSNYLKNYSADNIPQLIEFYNKTQRPDIKSYLTYVQNFKGNGFQEYNISKHKAYEDLKEFRENNKETLE